MNQEIREIIPPKLRARWHRLYFFNSLVYNFFGKTWLSARDQYPSLYGTYRNKLTCRAVDRWEEEILDLGKKAGEGRILDLPRAKNISPEEFYRQYLRPSRAVVLEGAAKDWPCVRKWNLDFFKNNYGDRNILVAEGKNWFMGRESPDEYYKSIGTPQEYLISDFIDDIRKGGSQYATFYPFLLYHPELVDYLDMNFLQNYFHMNKKLPWQKRFYPKLFLGGPGTATPMHCAGINNLFVQIYGEKQWDLWTPESAPLLYPEHAIRNNCGTIAIDCRQSDWNGFPLAKYADRYRVVLKPGDVLFVPPWWFHGVQNLTESIAVSNFIIEIRSALKGKSFFSLAIMDPWTIPALVSGNEDAAKEWEANLPKSLYFGRNSYFGQFASFFHFLFSLISRKLGFSNPSGPR